MKRAGTGPPLSPVFASSVLSRSCRPFFRPMRTLLTSLALIAAVGCANTEVASRYDWEPETSYGVEYTGHNLDRDADQAFGPVAGIGLNYTPASTWGRDRLAIKPKVGVRYEIGKKPRWWVEGGMQPHLIPEWTSGTWAELTGYVRVGTFFDLNDRVQGGPWIEVNHQFSNADRDTFGEHPRRPGFGFALGWTFRW